MIHFLFDLGNYIKQFGKVYDNGIKRCYELEENGMFVMYYEDRINILSVALRLGCDRLLPIGTIKFNNHGIIKIQERE